MFPYRILYIIYIPLVASILEISLCLECKRNVIFEEEENHECERICEYPAKPKICQYNFKVGWMFSMSTDCYNCPYNISDCSLPGCVAGNGVVRPLVATNGNMPGPSIQVCEGDTVRVQVSNDLVDVSGLTVHWYGMYQFGTNWMDGSSMITQCPVMNPMTFVYQFKANPAGTHWWHAHGGIQRDDGMFGPLIVRKPKELERNGNEYDVDGWDTNINVIDWWSRPTLQVFLTTLSPSKYAEYPNQVLSLLVNGKSLGAPVNPMVDPTNDYYTTFSTFDVEPGLTYRFRLISAVFGMCSLHVSIESHYMTVIALDGSEVMPIDVESITIAPGERIDFVVRANQVPSAYCIYFRGTTSSNCTNGGAAYLLYKNSASRSTDYKECLNYNQYENYDQMTPFSIFDTYALDPLKDHMMMADVRQIIKLTSYTTPIVAPHGRVSEDGELTRFRMNGIEFSSPSSTFYGIRDTVKTCTGAGEVDDDDTSDQSPCTHVLKIKLGRVVDIVLFNKDTASHAMHLHGHSFRVLAVEKVDTTKINLYNLNQISPEKAVVKDTVNVPAGGYAIVRTWFNNPGYWMLHDQINSFYERGMAMVIQVGEESEIPKPPPSFPACGPWSPD